MTMDRQTPEQWPQTLKGEAALETMFQEQPRATPLGETSLLATVSLPSH